MSSILLLLDDGEMHPLMTGQNGGQIVLRGAAGHGEGEEEGEADYTDAVITADGETLTLGSHFLTAEDLAAATAATTEKDEDGNLITKIEVDGNVNVPVEFVVEKNDPLAATELLESMGMPNGVSAVGAAKRRANMKGVKEGKVDTDRKVCLWPTNTGATCGKTFTKFDSLKRHLQEAHKGLRPFACTLCDKSYGRRDYLQRHLKSHNASYAVNLAGGTTSSQVMANATAQAAAQIVKKVHVGKDGQQPQSIVVQVPQSEFQT